MTYVLFILFILNPNTPTASIATYSAEFNDSGACWAAADSIRSPFDRDAQWDIQTVTTCVGKGQPAFNPDSVRQ